MQLGLARHFWPRVHLVVYFVICSALKRLTNHLERRLRRTGWRRCRAARESVQAA
jgi:hypothetical protein